MVIQGMINRLGEVERCYRRPINVDKTKVMTIS